MFTRPFRLPGVTLVLLGLAACGKPADPPPPSPPAAARAAADASTPSATAEAPPVKKVYWTDEMLHTEIKYHNPAYAGDGQFEIRNGQPLALVLRGCQVESLRFVDKLEPLMLDLSETPLTDLGPLRGKPVVELYLEDTQATDLSALRGMPLEKLYLSRTPARDLSALENAPLVELNVIHSQVADISALATCQNLQMLWLTDCPVEDISALAKPPLISVTLHRTKVRDLRPLAGTRLQRLHIGETPVTDLTPLKGLRLTRLVFTPANITKGLDIARALPLQEIGTQFDDGGRDLAPPDVFWAKFDAEHTPRPPLALPNQ